MVENRERALLLVEDNRDEEELVVRVLRKGNIQNPVVVCRDGAAALDYIFGTGTSAGRDPVIFPAVTMLDLKLPKVDGLTILKRIRADERTRMMPVVVFTSSNQESDVLQCYELGANSCVRKPVEFEQYVETVRLIASYWLSQNQLPPRRKLPDYGAELAAMTTPKPAGTKAGQPPGKPYRPGKPG